MAGKRDGRATEALSQRVNFQHVTSSRRGGRVLRVVALTLGKLILAIN
jgi:hypothetical protein